MEIYDYIQQPERLTGGRVLPAPSRPLAVQDAGHAGHALLAAINPMTWRGPDMVCGRGPAKSTQGISGTDVTEIKFVTRVGTASCSPPV